MVKSKTSPNIILAAIDSRATGETYPVVATVPWKEGVENDNLYIFQDTTKLNPTFLIGSNEQLDINPRSKSFTLEAVKIGVSTGEKTYADLNVTQEKATYEYTLEIKSKSGEITIPASGGSLELKGISLPVEVLTNEVDINLLQSNSILGSTFSVDFTISLILLVTF